MIGTRTASGPKRTQVGVGMGDAVNVGVMVEVGVIVAVAVGEDVTVTVAVAVGLANTPAPHPDNKIDNPKNKMATFFIQFLCLLDFIPNSTPCFYCAQRALPAGVY